MTHIALEPQETPAHLLAEKQIARILEELGDRSADLVADALRADEIGRIDDGLIAFVRERGCFRVTADPAIGGYGAGVAAVVEMAHGIARYHPSLAWNCVVSNSHTATSQCFPEPPLSAAGERDPDIPFCGVYGSRDARIREIDGTHRLTGSWPSASGAAHAEWATVNAAHDSLGPVFLILPMRDLSVRETWRAIGMRGTASDTLIADDVAVPRTHILTVEEFEKSGRGDTLALRLPKPHRTSMALAAVGLGAAEGLAALIAARGRFETRARPILGGESTQTAFDVAFVRASSRLESAWTLLIDTARSLDRWAYEHDAVSPDQVTLTRTRLSRVTQDLADTVHELSLMCGSATAFEGNPIGMYWRDAHVAARHGALSAAAGFDLGGALAVQRAAASHP